VILALVLACSSTTDSGSTEVPFSLPPHVGSFVQTHPLLRLHGDRFRVQLRAVDPDFRCDRGESRPELCDQDYRALAASLYPGTEAELSDCVDDLSEELLELREEVEAGTVLSMVQADNDELAAQVQALVAALAVDEAELHILAGPMQEEGQHRRIELTIEHPVLGAFPARLLLPTGAWQRAPTMLMLPGHLPEAESQLDDLALLRHGQRLADEGFMVLSLAFRAYDAGEHEARVTTELLCAGASLMALRQVEAAIALELLDALRPGDLPAVMGHSGGAVSALLLGTWAPTERIVLDAVADRFLNVQRSSDGGSVQILDETVPALVPWWGCLYSLGLDLGLPDLSCEREAAAVPHLYQGYGYAEEDWPELWAFLTEG